MTKPVETAEHMLRRNFLEVPRAHGAFDRFEQRVLADPLGAAEHQPVVDLLTRSLHAMGEERDDMVGVVGVDPLDVVNPSARPSPRRQA